MVPPVRSEGCCPALSRLGEIRSDRSQSRYGERPGKRHLSYNALQREDDFVQRCRSRTCQGHLTHQMRSQTQSRSRHQCCCQQCGVGRGMCWQFEPGWWNDRRQCQKGEQWMVRWCRILSRGERQGGMSVPVGSPYRWSPHIGSRFQQEWRLQRGGREGHLFHAMV